MDELRSQVLLLVDDEENILRSLKRLFRRDGYRILTATSGAQGLEVLKQERVGVIISDHRMPGMTGTDFLQQVKAIYPDTVRIILSGYTDLESVTDSINRGAIYKFLTKPWDDDLLSQNVREAFRISELNAQNLYLSEALKRANQELEARVALKTKQLRFNISALKISHDILEELPIVVMGISEGQVIVANRCSRQCFDQLPLLLGQRVDEVFPDDIVSLYREAEKGTGLATGDVMLKGEVFRCRCQKNTSVGTHKGFIMTLRQRHLV
ncbi:MAG: response regulator RpfG family c-di-GMP phosphodiesterase [Motiliproteus sp.]|jgi:response regulator RpfG family c-di-GMP phosphodiesterase